MRFFCFFTTLVVVTPLLATTALATPAPLPISALYAPNANTDKGGFGLEYMRPLRTGWHGFGLWLSGSPLEDPEAMDSPFPRPDYEISVETDKGTVGALYLRGFGNRKAMAILGLGVDVERTIRTVVDSETGSKWLGGDDNAPKLQAQLGFRIGLGDGAGLRVGYDTRYKMFFGLSGRF